MPRRVGAGLMARQFSTERLLQTLYRSLDDPESLTDFLDEACAATRSQIGSVHTHDFATGQGSLPTVVGTSRDAAVAYDQRYASQNIIMQRSAHLLATGSVHVSDDEIPLEELRRSDYWREYLSLLDVDHAAGLCGTRDVENVAMLTLFRSRRIGKYQGKELELLDRLAPHWVNACQIRKKLGTLHDTISNLHAAFDRVAVAVIFIDARGNVCRINHGAERMFSRGHAVTRRNHKLVARDPADARRLNQAISAAVQNTTADIGCGPHVATRLVLHDVTGASAAFASVHPLMGGANTDPANVTANAVVFIRSLFDDSIQPLADALSELFGLTKAEARLTAALHGSGDLAHAAQSSGMNVDTARTHLKTVFDKTGTHSQSALVKTIAELRSVLGAA